MEESPKQEKHLPWQEIIKLFVMGVEVVVNKARAYVMTNYYCPIYDNPFAMS